MVLVAGCREPAAPAPPPRAVDATPSVATTHAVAADAASAAASDAAPEVAAAAGLQLDAAADALPSTAVTKWQPGPGASVVKLGAGTSSATSAHGVTVSVKRHHKHYVGGGTLGIWQFTFTKGAQTQTLEVRGDFLLAEAIVLGQLVLIDGADDGEELTFVPKAPKPLTEDEAHDLAEKDLAARGVTKPSSSSSSVENGVYAYRRLSPPALSVHVGLYTRHVRRVRALADPKDDGAP